LSFIAGAARIEAYGSSAEPRPVDRRAPGAGKTTVATRIARRYGLRWYGADTQTWAHRDRALGEGHPAALRWEALTPAERWETATPTEVLEMSLHAERGTMIVDDVQRLPRAPLI